MLSGNGEANAPGERKSKEGQINETDKSRSRRASSGVPPL